ncbi:hypothetical protein K435DRAFT_246115 [Dendrothele bispora CBS 962.96]|uniref:Uncharacterized protein n=1 Tax=Dendrothele bispora (strain CBS 962.96) TaxID=1314807 RepID=A0A4S8KJM7_DENBC|nr:hypothetical protein K435DRAFT_246115 [Dendrothele bispora CBS 962.96]
MLFFLKFYIHFTTPAIMPITTPALLWSCLTFPIQPLEVDTLSARTIRSVPQTLRSRATRSMQDRLPARLRQQLEVLPPPPQTSPSTTIRSVPPPPSCYDDLGFDNN